MELRKRDKLVIETLINQDYCFYQDISRKFYPSLSSASHGLRRLIEGGYISVEPVEKIKGNEALDDLSFNFLRNNKKALRLGERYKVLRGKVSPWKKLISCFFFL